MGDAAEDVVVDECVRAVDELGECAAEDADDEELIGDDMPWDEDEHDEVDDDDEVIKCLRLMRPIDLSMSDDDVVVDGCCGASGGFGLVVDVVVGWIEHQ